MIKKLLLFMLPVIVLTLTSFSVIKTSKTKSDVRCGSYLRVINYESFPHEIPTISRIEHGETVNGSYVYLGRYDMPFPFNVNYELPITLLPGHLYTTMFYIQFEAGTDDSTEFELIIKNNSNQIVSRTKFSKGTHGWFPALMVTFSVACEQYEVSVREL